MVFFRIICLPVVSHKISSKYAKIGYRYIKEAFGLKVFLGEKVVNNGEGVFSGGMSVFYRLTRL